MYEQNQKLEVVRRRCRISGRVIGILQIIAIVLTVLTLVGAIICFIERNALERYLTKAVEAGQITVNSFRIGTNRAYFMMDFDRFFEIGDFVTPLMFSCIMAALGCIIITIILGIFKSIFYCLDKEESPFSDKIIKQLRINFIIITLVFAVYIGIIPAVVVALLMWCIFSVLEYGKALQTEVDEIL